MSTIDINLAAAAIAAFRRGTRWHQFVQEHRTAIQQAEQASPGSVQKLLHLVVSGEHGGMEPVDVDNAWGQGTMFDCSEQYR